LLFRSRDLESSKRHKTFPSIPVFETIQQINGFHAELSILSPCLFALALLIVAARELVMTDY